MTAKPRCFACPNCQAPHRTLAGLLTCCPRETRALSAALEANSSLGTMKGLASGLAGPGLRKAAADLLNPPQPLPPTVAYPGVVVRLVGEDGNGFFIISRVRRALERGGFKEAGREFFERAMECDYDGVLALVQRTVTVR